MSAKPPRVPNVSRAGCWTCKKRHRKWDESKPSCRKCALYSEECEGYGVRRLAFRNNTGTIVQKFQKTLSAPQGLSHGWLHGLFSVQPTEEELRLLKEFVHSVSYDLGVSESYNIWRDDIAPLALAGDGQYLLHALCAVTAMHRTYLERKITCEAAMHYSAAVRELRAILAAHKKPGRPPDSILATLFLLMWFEVLACDWEKWNVHLAAICNMMLDSGPSKLWRTRFGQRLICAVARIDVPNTIWQLNPPLLDPKVYDFLHFEERIYDEEDLEEAAILAFNRLHALMAGFADVYSTWLRGSSRSSAMQSSMDVILGKLEKWHEGLPPALQCVPEVQGRRTPLQSILLIHYLSTKLLAMHVLNPNCSLQHDEANSFCRGLALQICSLVDNLGPTPKRRFGQFRGDVGIILPLSTVSMFLNAPAERAWISSWLREVNHEGIWCGWRRSMIVEAWGKCEQAGASARPLHTMIGDENINWKPGKGFNVRILTMTALENQRVPVQFYVEYDGQSQRLDSVTTQAPTGGRPVKDLT